MKRTMKEPAVGSKFGSKVLDTPTERKRMTFQAALKFWQEFNVHELQRELDGQAQEVVKRQDDSEVSRKKLVELSREFKRTSTEEVRRKVAPLLKSFQGEVDALSRRSQAAETLFLNTYKKIIDIPDPIPVLEQAIGQQQKLMQSQDHEIEVKQLRETLQEYNSEFAHVKNQEVTIQKLKDQIKDMEDKMEEMTVVKVREKSAEIMQSFQEKERELQVSTREALEKLAMAEAKTVTMQTALETTQSELFELKNKFEEEGAARAAELDILVTDLERANQRAAAAEKETERVQHLASDRQTTTEHDKVSTDRVELELELQARDKEISRLVDDIQRLQSNLSRLREASSVQVKSLEDQLAQKTELIASLELSLASQSDYEELKRELSVIKMVEFSVASSSAAVAQDGATSPAEGAAAPSKPLEVLLLEKNRSLQNENTSVKVELSELRDHFTSLKIQHTEALQKIQEQNVLIGRLESDLSLVHPYLPIRGEGEGQDATLSSAEIISEAIKDISVPSERKSVGEITGADSLLPIVTSQRERFKQRNLELEAESHQQRQTISVLQREVDSLRGDNVKLYEKIKFLQSYPGTRKSIDDRETMNRYSSQYEAHLDPFAAFNAKERHRKYSQLSGPDKATLVLGRFILSNKVARMVAFIYTIVLHLLIFLVITRLMYSESCENTTYMQCAQLFSEHMQLFHPEHADDILKSLGREVVGRGGGVGGVAGGGGG